MKKIIAIIFLLLLPSFAYAATCETVTKNGVTWTFSEAVTCGTFANGDYWVVAPVTITAISPDYDGTTNGWMVNPTTSGQSYDKRTTYDSYISGYFTEPPSLPYAASAGQSIVKSIGKTPLTTWNHIDKMAVLTVLASAPANPSNTFRPGYAGTDKTLYYVSDLQTDELLNISTVSSEFSYDDITTYFGEMHYEISPTGKAIKYLRPYTNMGGSSYAPDTGLYRNRAIAKLSQPDTAANKLTALIYMVQNGIDTYNCALAGNRWLDGGGIEPGHKLALAFAALMLNNQNLKDMVNQTWWWENRMIHDGLYGKSEYQTELKYWQGVAKDPGQSVGRWDPYRQIDGGAARNRIYDGYQKDAANVHKGAANWLRYWPSMQTYWSDAASFIAYNERWYSQGTKVLPDTCAPVDAADLDKDSTAWTQYGITWGPDPADRTITASRPYGDCIEGSGRFDPAWDSLYADESTRPRAIVMDEMWELYGQGESEFLFSVTLAGDGNGVVTGSPAGMNCGTLGRVPCSSSHTAQNVTLTATPDADSTFSGWSAGSGSASACSGTDPCVIPLAEASGVTATFALGVPNYIVTISQTGGGQCGLDPVPGSYLYETGTVATISLYFDEYSYLYLWSGTCGCTGSGACGPTITADCTIIAECHSRLPAPIGGGSFISGNGGAVNYGSGGSLTLQ